MPIIRIDLDARVATQRCAACNRENTVHLGDLQVGDGPDDGGAGLNPDAIRLPTCACGARESVFRTWDACPGQYGETFFADHRRVVNGLAQYLIGAGQSRPAAAALHAAEKRTPVDTIPLPPRGHVEPQHQDEPAGAVPTPNKAAPVQPDAPAPAGQTPTPTPPLQ